MECRCVLVRSSGYDLFGECAAPEDTTFLTVDGGDTFTIGLVAGSREVVGWGRAFYGELLVVEKGFQALKLPEPCRAVSCGMNHVMALTDSGRVLTWGWNKFGQVAVATEQVVRAPSFVKFPGQSIHIIDVAAGGMHSLALDTSGRVWAWGCNEYGQLGVGSEGHQLYTPTLVPLPSDVHVQGIAAGWAHSAMISRTGEVLTFGWGLYNQLGHGSTQNERQPTVVDALHGLDSNIVQIACGNWHTAALTASGDLYTWGWGRDGQLGSVVSTATQVLPRVVTVSGSSGVADEAQDVISLACGPRFTLALCRDGSVQYWGPRSASTDARQADGPTSTSLLQPEAGRRVHKLAAGNSLAILLLKKQ